MLPHGEISICSWSVVFLLVTGSSEYSKAAVNKGPWYISDKHYKKVLLLKPVLSTLLLRKER